MGLLLRVELFREGESLLLVLLFFIGVGTPECSYNVQQADEPLVPCSCLPFVAMAISLIVIFLLGSPILFGDLSQSEL